MSDNSLAGANFEPEIAGGSLETTGHLVGKKIIDSI